MVESQMRWLNWRLLLALGLLPVVLFGLSRIETDIDDVYQWLPESGEERREYDRFNELFGADDMVIVTWPGATLDNPLVEELAAAIRRQDTAGLIREVITGSTLLAQLTAAPYEFSEQDVREKLAGEFIGQDGRTTCLLVRFTAQGQRRRLDGMALVLRSAQDFGLSEEDLRLAGGPYFSWEFDRNVKFSLFGLTGPSILVSTLLAWLCLRNLRVVAVLFLVATGATALSSALVPLTGERFNALLPAMPTLIFVTTVSGGMHLISYYQHAVISGMIVDRASASREILRMGLRPTLVSTLTTAQGVGALFTSQYPAIQEFGAYSSAGAVFSLIVMLSYLPAGLAAVAPPELIRQMQHSYPAAHRWRDYILEGLLKRNRVVLAATALLAVTAAVSLPRLGVSMNLEDEFRSDSPYLQNALWLERTFGPVERSELLVEFPLPSEMPFVDRLEAVRAVAAAVEVLPEVAAVDSATDYIPENPAAEGSGSLLVNKVYRYRVDQIRDELLNQTYLAATESGEYWRLTLRASMVENLNYRLLDTQVRKAAAGKLEELELPDVSVAYTGTVPLYYRGQEQMIQDLFVSFATAFLLILPMMVLALRGFTAGLLAMVPNVLPVLLVFGVMALLGVNVTPGVVITASLALGIAVDDTTHFLCRYQSHRPTPTTQLGVLKFTYAECSAAMFQTMLICCLGQLVLAASPISSLQQFAITIVLFMTVALACDLLVLPGILASRLARFFWLPPASEAER